MSSGIVFLAFVAEGNFRVMKFVLLWVSGILTEASSASLECVYIVPALTMQDSLVVLVSRLLFGSSVSESKLRLQIVLQ